MSEPTGSPGYYLSPVKELLLENQAAPIQAMLYAFHAIYGLTYTFDDAAFRDKELRQKLIEEEFKEVIAAFEADDLENAAKEMADLIYVLAGAFLAFGIDMDAVFKEVHRSNLSKLGEDGRPIYNDIGKVQKGPNYSPAQIKPLLH